MFGFPAVVHSDNAKCLVRGEIKQFFTERGISTTFVSVYNSFGNSQCECYNGVIWNAVRLALRTNGMEISQWESVIPQALQSLRSLLCTSTNETPHERLLKFPRRSSFGLSVPTWLTEESETVFLKRHVRNKYDPLEIEVKLVRANPNYAVVRHPDGREATVSTRDLAPTGVDPRDQETSNDLVPTCSEVHLGEWESTSSENMPRHPTNDPVQSPAQKSTINSPRSELQAPLQ